ncbi:MAG: fumarylacetoacetate hydrolase family protein [Candidatus Eremiobacteraeota bacterium]|nr:fumarylacetoacetate hydrolase family protein [Candidatus Eremiobacteraeota bacterium]
MTTIYQMLDLDDAVTYENAKRFGGFTARFVRFADASGRVRVGLADLDSVRPFPDAFNDLRQIVALDADALAATIAKLGDERLPLANVTLKAPIVPPKNVFCIGRNYLGHAEEGARARGEALVLPAVPTIFTKAPTSIADPGEVLELQARLSKQYDFEAELAVVIGTRCRDVSEESALDVVFGYTCINDVTARDVQKATTQWFKGKTLDHTCPMGPWIVPKEAFDDPQAVEVKMRVNGIEKQSAPTSTMIFSVRRIIAELSAGCTLEPGDVIATGTPEGVGFARTPPEFLKDGDVMEVDIERIGVLRNTVHIR